MAQQTINNGEAGGVVRGKINDNFTELYADKHSVHAADSVAFTPDGDIEATTVQAAIKEVRDEADSKITNVSLNGGYF